MTAIRAIDTLEYDQFKAIVTAALVKLGWEPGNPYNCCPAFKEIKSLGGTDNVVLWLSQYDREHWYLTGEYTTEGNNVLSTTTCKLPKSLDEAAIHQQVSGYVERVESVIGQCRMVRLYRARQQ
ncbi:MAG: hypothetical protein GJ680_07470 [Alteromonadaceae bacterium]|nr:hypothetical protein [Alteromonadaceae bacterium]